MEIILKEYKIPAEQLTDSWIDVIQRFFSSTGISSCFDGEFLRYFAQPDQSAEAMVTLKENGINVLAQKPEERT